MSAALPPRQWQLHIDRLVLDPGMLPGGQAPDAASLRRLAKLLAARLSVGPGLGPSPALATPAVDAGGWSPELVEQIARGLGEQGLWPDPPQERP